MIYLDAFAFAIPETAVRLIVLIIGIAMIGSSIWFCIDLWKNRPLSS